MREINDKDKVLGTQRYLLMNSQALAINMETKNKT